MSYYILVKVCPLLPFSKVFDYVSNIDVSEGDIVKIPFGKMEIYGVVFQVGEIHSEENKRTLKEITSVILRAVVSSKLISIVKAAAKYNCGKEGMFLRLVFPFSKFTLPEIKEEFELEISLTSEASEKSLRSRMWKDLWFLLQEKKSIELSSFKISLKELSKLTSKNLLFISKKPLLEVQPNINLALLSSEQIECANKIEPHLKDEFKAFLIEGETGSGKTEVYFYLIEKVIKEGGQALLMLPEIALSSAILSRFKDRFGFEAVLWHSSVSERKKIDNYLKINNGTAKVIIGTRSSLFLPYKNLKLIIVDEEHDSSYKQEDITIYNGRDMAVLRASLQKIPIILGSATPAIESYNNVKNGKYTLTSLKNRFFASKMPKITIVDMRKESMERNTFISPAVRSKILSTLKAGGQSMLFLNRRGYAPIVICGACGAKIKCKFCDVFLTEHRMERKLKCHHCSFVRDKPSACETCETPDTFRVIGVGAERIKEELETIVSAEKIILLTSDTLTSTSKLHEVMEKIKTGKAEVIVGTQVVSKGYHFPNLKFVGILDADFGLNIEDFRAFEKTFQLLYQVAGRSGRESEDGEVYIQTFDSRNKVLASIAIYDKEGFYALELSSRLKFKLPPFSKQIGFIVSGEDKDLTLQNARGIALALEKELSKINGISIFGPSLASLSYLRGRYRYRILILSTEVFALQSEVIKVLENEKIAGNLFLKIDVDPISFY